MELMTQIYYNIIYFRYGTVLEGNWLIHQHLLLRKQAIDGRRPQKPTLSSIS